MILTGRDALPSEVQLPAYVNKVVAIHPPDLPLAQAMDPQITRDALTQTVTEVLSTLKLEPENI